MKFFTLPLILLSLLSSCAGIKSSRTSLPPAKYINKIPEDTKKNDDKSRKLIVIDTGEKTADETVCYVKLVVWGKKRATREELVERMVSEANQISADYLFIGNMNTDFVGISHTPMGPGGFASRPVFQNSIEGFACLKSEVYLGLVAEKGKILYVRKDSLAERQGLKEGMQIVAVNGRAVATDEYALQIEVNSRKKGTMVDIEVLDFGGDKKSFKFALE